MGIHSEHVRVRRRRPNGPLAFAGRFLDPPIGGPVASGRMSRVLDRSSLRRGLLRLSLILGLACMSAAVSARPPAPGTEPGRVPQGAATRAPATPPPGGSNVIPASRAAPPPPVRPSARRTVELLAGFSPTEHRADGELLVADLTDGRRAELTLDRALQAHVESMFRSYEVPYGAVVAIEPSTGRILAYVSHSSVEREPGDIALDPAPPAASVFKIVTGSALVDNGVEPGTRVCYGGGLHRLALADLEDDSARDRQCATLTDAMGSSINAVFAKLADRNLRHSTLERYASAFGFGQALPFDVATRPSPMDVPDDRLEFARTAAGFWHMHMSPFHAALIAATIANDGTMPRASMVERIVAADGAVLHRFAPSDYRSVLPPATARRVGTMMRRTVTHGTAHSAFFDERGTPFLPGIAVAGKTGTLTRESPYRGYTWWVGYAPADAPRIAVAALVINSPEWRIKASYAARETLRQYLMRRPTTAARAAR